MTTSADIVNRVLDLIGSQATITSLTDGSVEANAANVVYAQTVQLILRQLDPDFARTTATLAQTAANNSLGLWLYEYLYPSDCIRARQVRPPAAGVGALIDPFDPLPIRAQVAFDPKGGAGNVPAKVIFANQQNALLTYTTLNVTENQWDTAFEETVIRRLANYLGMGIAGRPDFARELLEESERYAGLAELADESSDGTV